MRLSRGYRPPWHGTGRTHRVRQIAALSAAGVRYRLEGGCVVLGLFSLACAPPDAVVYEDVVSACEADVTDADLPFAYQPVLGHECELAIDAWFNVDAESFGEELLTYVYAALAVIAASPQPPLRQSLEFSQQLELPLDTSLLEGVLDGGNGPHPRATPEAWARYIVRHTDVIRQGENMDAVARYYYGQVLINADLLDEDDFGRRSAFRLAGTLVHEATHAWGPSHLRCWDGWWGCDYGLVGSHAAAATWMWLWLDERWDDLEPEQCEHVHEVFDDLASRLSGDEGFQPTNAESYPCDE